MIFETSQSELVPLPEIKFFGPKGHGPEQEEWVFVDYGVGDSLTSPEMVDEPKQRSIFVVNVEYIQRFFSQLRPS